MPLFEELECVVDDEPHGAALNMAIDEVLLRLVEKPVLRVYRWARPALSFGYFVKLAEVEPLAARRELVRRWTGGGVVPHGDDFTFSLIVPREHPVGRLSAPESYREIHAVVAAALGGAELAVADAPETSNACFENPRQSDVLMSGTKVAGGAQRRSAKGLLHQGSLRVPGLPFAFGETLAAELAEHAVLARLHGATLKAAEEVAAERYATDEWLHRH